MEHLGIAGRGSVVLLKSVGRYVACLAMIGVGAIIGTLVGGNSNAARSPGMPQHEAATEAVAAPAPAAPQRSAAREQAAPRAPDLPPAATVAMRFPTHWHRSVMPGVHFAPETMAFAPEPSQRAAAPANSGYQLASVDPAPATAPLPPRRKPQARSPLLFNDAQLASIKQRLRLTPQQEQYWPQVEQALRGISWKLATEQDSNRPVRGNQAAMIDPSSPEVARLKTAALPLIMSLRADQKEEVRQLAHTMGLSKVAAMF